MSDDEHKIEAFRRVVEDEVLTKVFDDLEAEYLEKSINLPSWFPKKRSKLVEAIGIVREVRRRIETMYDHAQAMKRAEKAQNP